MTFFGGDHTKAHYTVNYERPSFTTLDRRRVARERHAAAKAAGIKERLFQFVAKDAKAKAKAKAEADKFAAQLRRKHPDIPIEVVEGSFL